MASCDVRERALSAEREATEEQHMAQFGEMRNTVQNLQNAVAEQGKSWENKCNELASKLFTLRGQLSEEINSKCNELCGRLNQESAPKLSVAGAPEQGSNSFKTTRGSTQISPSTAFGAPEQQSNSFQTMRGNTQISPSTILDEKKPSTAFDEKKPQATVSIKHRLDALSKGSGSLLSSFSDQTKST